MPLKLLDRPVEKPENRHAGAGALAARNAHRMAETLGEERWATVGYTVRLERKMSHADRGRHRGIPPAASADPELTGVGLVSSRISVA
jgi:hypothetical protein